MSTLAPNHHRPHPPLGLGRVDLGNTLSARGRFQAPEERTFSFSLLFFLESATNGLGWSSEKTWDGWEKELICIIDLSFAVLVSLHHFLFFPFSFGHRPLTGTGGGHGAAAHLSHSGFLINLSPIPVYKLFEESEGTDLIRPDSGGAAGLGPGQKRYPLDMFFIFFSLGFTPFQVLLEG